MSTPSDRPPDTPAHEYYLRSRGNLPAKTMGSEELKAELSTHFAKLNDTLTGIINHNKDLDQRVVSIQDSVGDIQTSQQPLQQIQDQVDRQSRTKTVSHLLPAKFTGSYLDDVVQFIDKIDLYATFAKLDDDGKNQILPLLLDGRALIWYKSLANTQKDTWEHVKASLTDHYGPTAKGFIQESALLDRSQAESESVEKYTTDMVSRLSLTGTKEPERWKAFVRGLKPAYKSYVLDKEPKSLDDAEKYARKAEQLAFLQKTDHQTKDVTQTQATATVNALSELTQVTANLGKQLEATQTEVRGMKTRLFAINAQSDRQPRPSMQYRQQQYAPRMRNNQGQPRCDHCQRYGHYTNQCRVQNLREIVCRRCNKKGHIARECYSNVNSNRGRPQNRNFRTNRTPSPGVRRPSLN